MSDLYDDNVMTFENLCSITAELNYQEKIITQLKKQIEQMKCCENCNDYDLCAGNFDCIANNYVYWKLKEND